MTRGDILLRITETEVEGGPVLVTLKLEGRIVAEWVPLLEHECLRFLREKKRVVLDFSAVTFINGPGIEMLERITTENLKIVNCSPFIEALLLAGMGQ